MLKTTIILLTILSLLSCNGNGDSGSPAIAEFSGKMVAREALQSQPMSDHQEGPTKKIIKSGSLTLKVENAKQTYQAIVSELDKFDASIENENQSTQNDRINYNLTIRVVRDKFDELFNSLAGKSEWVEHRSVNANDVSERYYDLETRIKNQKALEQRYLELLKKTTSIKEILEIERNLNDIRTEIEIKQGQFNYLSRQVEYSTIHLGFYELLPYTYNSEARPGFLARIKKSLSNGWQNFLSVLVGAISLWPFVIGFVAVVVVVKRWRRRS